MDKSSREWKPQKCIGQGVRQISDSPSITKARKKSDKVKAIICHVLQMKPNVQLEQTVQETDMSSDEEILAMHAESSDEDGAVSDSADDIELDTELLPITVRTHSERCAGAFSALQIH